MCHQTDEWWIDEGPNDGCRRETTAKRCQALRVDIAAQRNDHGIDGADKQSVQPEEEGGENEPRRKEGGNQSHRTEYHACDGERVVVEAIRISVREQASQCQSRPEDGEHAGSCGDGRTT